MAIIILRHIACPSEAKNVAPAIMTRFEPFGFNQPELLVRGIFAAQLWGFSRCRTG